jgi:hypothetical protein
MGERGVHNVGMRNSEKQLVNTNAGKQVRFSKQPIVRGAL